MARLVCASPATADDGLSLLGHDQVLATAGRTPFPLMLACMVLGGRPTAVNPLLLLSDWSAFRRRTRGRRFAATSAFAQLLPAMTIPLTGLAIQQIGLDRRS